MEEGAEETVSGSGEDGANVDAGEAAPLRAEEERVSTRQAATYYYSHTD